MLLFFKYVTINRTAFGSEALFELKKKVIYVKRI